MFGLAVTDLVVLGLYLLIGLFILTLWNSLYMVSHIQLTYATELDKIESSVASYEPGFSSEHYSPAQVDFYQAVKKFTQHGFRILPVFLWLFFFLLARRPRRHSSLDGKDEKSSNHSF